MRKISVAVCLDNNLGMMFYGKRQSRDRVLCEEFLKSTDGKTIYVNSYTKKLFEDAENVVIVNNPLQEAKNGSVVFAEDLDIEEYLSDIEEFIIYRWNRSYPDDKTFDIDLESEGFSLFSVSEFEGSSHERITKEIHRR